MLLHSYGSIAVCVVAVKFIYVYRIIFIIVGDLISVYVEEGEAIGVGFGLGDFFDLIHNLIWYWVFIELSACDAISSIEANKLVDIL